MQTYSLTCRYQWHILIIVANHLFLGINNGKVNILIYSSTLVTILPIFLSEKNSYFQTCFPPFFFFFLRGWRERGLGTIPRRTQDLFQALCSGVTSKILSGPLNAEGRTGVGYTQANTLTPRLSLHCLNYSIWYIFFSNFRIIILRC